MRLTKADIKKEFRDSIKDLTEDYPIETDRDLWNALGDNTELFNIFDDPSEFFAYDLSEDLIYLRESLILFFKSYIAQNNLGNN